MTLLPYVAGYLSEEAPGVNVHTVPIEGRLYERLDHQEADYGLTALGDVPDRFAHQTISSDQFICMMRSDHPLAKYKDHIPVEEYAAARHVLVSPRGDAHGFVDDQLRDLGLKRRIVMMVNNFGSAPMLVTNSDLIVTVPSRIAEKCLQFFDIHVVPSPISPPSSMIGGVLLWHRRLTNHPAHTWFRNLILRAGEDLDKHGVKGPKPRVPF
jgi:DNA-binding transcriptional LysR family regulator